MNLPLYDIDGKSAGEVTAPVDIFGRKPNDNVVHSAVVWVSIVEATVAK